MTTTSNEPLRAERFVLTPVEVAAALSIAGLTPSPRSDLVVDASTEDARTTLSSTGLLNDSGQIRPAPLAALRVASDPTQMLTVVANRAGRTAWTESTFVQSGDGGAVIAQAIREAEVDLALLPTPAQALVTLDELLGVSDLPSRAGGNSFRLDLPGYAALLATSDFLHEARLEARLARERRPLPAITVEAVEAQLVRGLASNDTRWAVTASRAVCPADLTGAVGHLRAGLDGLAASGLLARNGDRMTPSDQGLELFTDLDEIVNSAGLLLASAEGGSDVVVAHMTLLRCARAIWFVAWRGIDQDDAQVEVFQSSVTGALGVLDGLLSPAAVEA